MSVDSRRRGFAGVLALATVAAGLGVHLVLPDTAASDVAGDVLYTVLIYLLLIVLRPRTAPSVIGALTVAWCVAVELFQLTGLPLAWGAAWPPIMLVLGSVFDVRDLIVYTASGLAVGCADTLLNRRR